MQATQSAPKLNVHRIADRDHVLLRFEGVLDEDFVGSDLAGDLDCETLVIDLSGITRLTSFGIREWVDFIDRANARCQRSYLVDCSTRVVVQLNMVMRFAGRASVLSIIAPYHCENCGADTLRRLDVLQHEQEIRGADPQPIPCDACGATAEFDDEPNRYLAFVVSQPRPNVPPDTAAFLARQLDYQVGQGSPQIRISKLVAGDKTVIRLLGELNNTLPGDQLTEGVEGEVLFDLSGVTRVTPSGAHLCSGLVERMLRETGAPLTIFGCPPPMIPALREVLAATDLLSVQSIMLPYRSEKRGTSFDHEIDIALHLDGLRAGSKPLLEAEDDDQLICIAEPKVLVEAAELPPVEHDAVLWELIEQARRTPERAEGSAALEGAAPTSRGLRWPWLVVTSLSLGAVAALAILLLFPKTPDPVASRPRYYEASHLAAPPWRDKSLFAAGSDLYSVASSTRSPDKATAFAEATHAAVEQLLHSLAGSIESERWVALVGKPVRETRKAIFDRFTQLKKQRKFQKLEQWRRKIRARRQRISQSWGETSRHLVPPVTEANYWESYREGDELSYRVWAKVRLSKSNFAAARAYYAEEHKAQGVTVVAYFPLLCWSLPVDRGAIVVDASREAELSKAGLKAGDIVLRVNGQVVNDGVSFAKLVKQSHIALQATGGKLELELIDSQGKHRKIAVKVDKRKGGGGHRGPAGAGQELPPANIWHADPTR